jgi:hypothetical protein
MHATSTTSTNIHSGGAWPQARTPGGPRRRRLGDWSATEAATPPGTDPTPDRSNEHSSGHPNARGTLPMACHPPRLCATVLAEPRPEPAPQRPQQRHRRGCSEADRAIMRARLAAMAAPRDSDNEELAALRAILRDEALMARVTPTSSSGHR